MQRVLIFVLGTILLALSCQTVQRLASGERLAPASTTGNSEIADIYFASCREAKMDRIVKMHAALNRSECFLEYFQSGGKYYLLQIDKRQSRFFPVASIKFIDSLAEHYLSSIQNLKTDKRLGYILHKLLLPGMPENNYSSLIISPGPFVSELPLETLICDTLPGPPSYLLGKAAVYYSSSMKSFVSGQKFLNPKNNFLAIAPVYCNVEYPALNYSAVEARNASIGFTQSLVLTGDAATKENFIRQAPSIDILHISAHTHMNLKEPGRSCIYFTSRNHLDSLTISEIYTLPLQAQLAVLSSCQTSPDIFLRDETILSFSKAFHAAGAKNLVASCWKVPDKTTASIITDFYKNLRAGRPKSEALQLAKLHYLETADAMGAQPYFWAGLILSGDRTPVTLDAAGCPAHIFISIIPLLLASIILYFYRAKWI